MASFHEPQMDSPVPVSKHRMKGEQFEFWVSVKFTGPRYMNDPNAPDCIYIDRFLLVEPVTEGK